MEQAPMIAWIYLLGIALAWVATLVFFPKTPHGTRMLGATFWPVLLIVLLLTGD